MRLRVVILAPLGLALTLYLVMYVGVRAVLSAAASVGWGGFTILCGYSLVLFVPMGVAWRALLPAGTGWSLGVFIRARMVRDSAAEVLPFSQLGGLAFGVRAVALRGVPLPLASASMIADVTAEFLAQIAYVALGVAILATRLPHTSLVTAIINYCLIGLVLATVAAGLLIVFQRYSQLLTERFAAPLLRGAARAGAVLSAAFDAIHRCPARVVLSVLVHFAAWLGSAGTAWIAFRMIGAHVDLLAVLAIESLVAAGRSCASFVPSALGVQEAAYAGIAPLFGVGTEHALAVSVLKRARDIAIGIPVLLLWQAAEGRNALSRPATEKEAR